MYQKQADFLMESIFKKMYLYVGVDIASNS